MSLDLQANQLPLDRIFMGSAETYNVPGIREKVHAYLKTADYLKDKLPFQNNLLRYLSALSLEIRCDSITCSYLLKLAQMTTVVESGELVGFEIEVRLYDTSNVVPTSDNISRPIDEWWFSFSERFPLLTKFSLSMLPIFHGPEVERNFSLMTQTLNPHTSRLNTQAVSAVQTIKYFLSAERTESCIKFFGMTLYTTQFPKCLHRRCKTHGNKEMTNSSRRKIRGRKS